MSEIPRRLTALLKKCKGNQREAGRRLGVNAAHINKLVKHGVEPSNPEIRVKLFLPRKPKKPRVQSARPPLSEHMRWWKGCGKIIRNAHIVQLYAQWKRRSEKL